MNPQNTALIYACIALAGGFGAVLRMFLSDRLDTAGGAPRRIPLGTLAANLVAAFALGWLNSESALALIGRGHLFFALAVGFSASASTFSAFSFQLARMLKFKRINDALAYAILTMSAGAALAWLGMKL